ncbi:Glycosyltransferase family 4 protein [Rhodovastum atsumiense]|uniref:Glycosyltransferase family 4 protein n=1 Tax=Rhodovastum atsumiense TaxID=504468 RepID=A0A5M6J155_9PROT|nr:glycosyltransferase family 4 protein [Rhodovastum atsumiense]KAA5614323.1 glycosyltransferase family 4 protein [Rhodovastum atsumiense]CAH2604790.1 Glycosyltransferase family 4 protein [Rhodovastum atsumiense]
MDHGTPPGRPPVVLQVVPSLESGGVERGTVEIADAIVRAGGISLVASAGGRLVPLLIRAGARHIDMPLATRNPWAIWRNAGRLARLIRAVGVDIVHARSRAPAWSAWLAARRTGAHFITTYHAPYGEKPAIKRRYNAVMARGERVIAISHYVARLVAARHGVDPARIRVIPRGVDPAVFDPAAVKGERIARLALSWRLPDDGSPVILLPGRLTRWKGQEVLIAALARMRHHNAVAVMVGGDQGRRQYTAGLLQLADSLGVSERVRLVGHADDMAAALMLGDVVVSASTEPEGFGRVVIEAQAMARLVVASDHGGAAETVEEGVSGWRVPPGDAEALAAALDTALDLSPEQRAQAGARARAAVQARYTVADMQRATLAVYREVLAIPSR